MTTKEFAKILQDNLTSEYGVDLSVASHQQIYRALALICRQIMSENHKKFQSKAIGTGSKQVYYLCMEFLMGRSLKMSLFNLGLNDAAQKALAEADISLDSIYEEEPDAGLGNGGLSDALLTASLRNNLFLLLAALLCCFPILELPKKWMQKSAGAYVFFSITGTVLAAALFLLSSILLVDATNMPFLYTKF